MSESECLHSSAYMRQQYYDVSLNICEFGFLSPSRWVCFCHVPVFCESLQRYDATHVFGRTLLSSVFNVMRRQLMEKFTAEQDKMLPEKRSLVLNHFPRSVTTVHSQAVMVLLTDS